MKLSNVYFIVLSVEEFPPYAVIMFNWKLIYMYLFENCYGSLSLGFILSESYQIPVAGNVLHILMVGNLVLLSKVFHAKQFNQVRVNPP